MVDAISTSVSGLHKASAKIAKAADSIANPDNFDRFAEDIIDIKTAEVEYKANLIALQAASEIEKETGNILDTEA